MSSVIDNQEFFTKFLESFKTKENPSESKYELELSRCALEGKRSLVVDFNDLYNFDSDVAIKLIENPKDILPHYDVAAFSKLRTRQTEYADMVQSINVRIRNLPDLVLLRTLASEQIGKLVMIKGVITRATQIHPFILKGAFECSQCGETILVEQTDQFMKTPKECISCHSKRGFELNEKESVFIDNQRLTIQEDPNELPSGQLPRPMQVDLRDDLVEIARPGDRVYIVGSIQLIRKQGRGGTLKIFDTVLIANNLDVLTLENEVLKITEEDERQIQELAKDPKIFGKLMKSVAPSIYGLDHVKGAMVLQFFGGVAKHFVDLNIRDTINILLLGDPGVAKSKLLQYAAKTHPRGMLTTGRGVSGVGLTSAVVKDKNMDGAFILEAGALVLADQGVCCIDEMDKMREEDRDAIHPAMSDLKVQVDKGGIHATLNARTSVFAAANPPFGRYNPHVTIAANIGEFPVTLLSRFDLIFIIRDIPDSEKDELLSDHISNLHMQSEKIVDAPIDQLLLKKYITYARNRIKPKYTQESADEIKAIFLKMRAAWKDNEGAAISITPRQQESLIRLTEAYAKAHLRDKTTKEDAEAAIALFNVFLQQVGINPETGEIDIDILYTGKPRSLQVQLQKTLGIIIDLERIDGKARDDDVFQALEDDHNLGRSEGARLIGILMRDGTIYSPSPGFYKRCS